MNRPAFLRLAVIGVCAAVVLAGCGRKGPLDPPPGAAGPAQEQAPQQRSLVPRPMAEPDVAADERPVAQSAPQRRLPIDWLLN